MAGRECSLAEAGGVALPSLPGIGVEDLDANVLCAGEGGCGGRCMTNDMTLQRGDS